MAVENFDKDDNDLLLFFIETYLEELINECSRGYKTSDKGKRALLQLFVMRERITDEVNKAKDSQ